MMALVVFGAVGAAMAAFVLSERLRFRDLPLLVFLLSAAVFLSRFNLMCAVDLSADRALPGFLVYMCVVAVALWLLREQLRRSMSRAVLRVFQLSGIFALLALASGLFNGGAVGLVSSLQVLLITLPPLWVAGLVVDLMPRDPESTRRLRAALLLVMGVLVPCFVIVSALKPELFGGVLGWSAVSNEVGAGFVRGWSPLGNTISSGILIVMAYALALHEAAVGRRRRFALMAAACGLAILFTLARSVVLTFVIFHVAYWILYALRSRNRVVVVGPMILVGVLTIWALQSGYGFGRFVVTDDFSAHVRRTSAKVALRESFVSPLLGQGPGLTYPEPREGLAAGPEEAEKRRLQMSGDEMTATEPHNLYLWLMVEHGWVAAAVFLGMMVVIIGGTRRKPPHVAAEARSLQATYLATWIALLCFLLSHSDPLTYPKFSLFFWLWAFSGLHWTESVRDAEGTS